MRILLADDEPAIRRLYRQMLVGSGYDVTVAADGREALDAVGAEPFGLLILDLKMPRLDGFEVLERLRERQAAVPVLVMTGHYPGEVVAERIGAAPVVGVLRKPVMITTLLNAVREAVGPAQSG